MTNGGFRLSKRNWRNDIPNQPALTVSSVFYRYSQMIKETVSLNGLFFLIFSVIRLCRTEKVSKKKRVPNER